LNMDLTQCVAIESSYRNGDAFTMVPILNYESDTVGRKNFNYPHKFLSIDFACHLPKGGRNKRSQVEYSMIMRRRNYFEGIFEDGLVYNTQLQTHHNVHVDALTESELADIRINDRVKYQLMNVRDKQEICVPCHFRLFDESDELESLPDEKTVDMTMITESQLPTLPSVSEGEELIMPLHREHGGNDSMVGESVTETRKTILFPIKRSSHLKKKRYIYLKIQHLLSKV